MATEAIRLQALSDRIARERVGERIFRSSTFVAALLVLILLGGVIVALVHGSWPALSTFKLGFITTQVWNPVTEKFGALAPIYGTLMTSLLAMLVAVPLSFGIAIFSRSLRPRGSSDPWYVAIELLAAVPSIIYGIWGLFVFAPLLQQHVQPWLIDVLGPIPVVGKLFQGPPFGIGILTAGLILAVMVLPFISAVIRDVLRDRAGCAQGIGLRPWRNDLGSDLESGGAVFARGHHWRRHAWPRTRAGRDDGGDLRHWQRASSERLADGARYNDLRVHRQ